MGLEVLVLVGSAFAVGDEPADRAIGVIRIGLISGFCRYVRQLAADSEVERFTSSLFGRGGAVLVDRDRVVVRRFQLLLRVAGDAFARQGVGLVRNALFFQRRLGLRDTRGHVIAPGSVGRVSLGRPGRG